jgi:hypothetical protein
MTMTQESVGLALRQLVDRQRAILERLSALERQAPSAQQMAFVGARLTMLTVRLDRLEEQLRRIGSDRTKLDLEELEALLRNERRT